MTQDARIPTHPRNITQESNADRGTHQPVAPVLISVAEVMLGTAATHSIPIRRFDALRKLRTALLEARSALRSHPSRRDTYFERAAMAREMNRL
jgi:hypothetical protein